MSDEQVQVQSTTTTTESKGHDTLATLIGIGQAMLVSAMNYVTHVSASGDMTYDVSFWIGVGIAAFAGLQGYYSNKGPKKTTQTVDVDVKK